MKITSRVSLFTVGGSLPFVAFLIASFILPARADDEKVTIKQMIGNVEVRSLHSGAWRAARVGMIVRAGWDLWTFVESNAELLYETGTVIKVGENTVITLSALGQGANATTQTDVKVSTGQIWSNVKKLTNAGSKFEFETPTAVASIRGTRLGVSVGGDSSSVDVYEGVVMVRNKGSGHEIAVGANTRAEVVAGKSGVKTLTFSAAGGGTNGANPPKDPFGAGAGTGADTSGHQKRDTSGFRPDTARKIDTTGMNTTKPSATFALTVTTPLDGAVITSPLILVSGKTVAGAKVTVNGAQAAVASSGAFTYQVPIPDEPQDYSLEIIATYNDNEQRIARTVTYKPVRDPLQLVVTSPVAGQAIEQKILHITGKSAGGATVTVNGKQALVTPSGQFTFDLPLAEKDIGTLTLDFVATRDDQELTQSMDVVVDAASPQINTSAPQLRITGINQQATNNPQIQIQVTDATPEDQDTVTVFNTGAKEILVLDPGAKEPITLNEGLNSPLTIKCNDKAGNQSTQIQTSIYYLPGPITIDVQDPSESQLSIQDLPPFPRNTAMRPLHFKVLLDEGVGRLTDIYKYCKVISSGGTITLVDNKDCSFSGDVSVGRGTTVFTIQVQDIAGNTMTKTLTMRINQ